MSAALTQTALLLASYSSLQSVGERASERTDPYTEKFTQIIVIIMARKTRENVWLLLEYVGKCTNF